MSTDKFMSALRSIRAFFTKTIDKSIKYKNNATDFIVAKAEKTKIFLAEVKDKTVVFCGTVRYEAKGYTYNAYDKMRDLKIKYASDNNTPDFVEYKGEPKPKIRARMKSAVRTKMVAIRAKLPQNPSEFACACSKKHKKNRRAARSMFATVKCSCVNGIRYTGEYVQSTRKSTLAGLGSIAIGSFALVFMLTTIVSSYAMGVTINGERVGFVENEEAFAALVEDVEQDLSSENHNANIQIDEDAIEFDSMAGSKEDVTMLDQEQLKEKLVDTDVVMASGAAIVVDGKPILQVANKDDAYGVLNAIRTKYDVAGQDVFAAFTEDVSVVETEIDVNEIMPTSTAITYLLTGNQSIKKHVVKDDETNWDIAVANGLTEKDIKKANPGINTEVIKKGDVINISKTVPFVHMEVTATVTMTEKVDYKTKKIETNDLYVGESKVKREGKRGEKSVTKRAVFVNGKETLADVISEQTVSKSKNKVVLVGTKEKPAQSYSSGSSYSSGNSGSSSVYQSGGGSYTGGSGTLSKPMRNMILSSPFGWRGGRMHSGADYRNPAGTPIYAAKSGKVIYSGYDGAYGNTVRISHGGGMTTVYAHCSSLNVRSGASVSTGQQIATVGRTGRATGNHLHFEVRINGTARNPANYL